MVDIVLGDLWSSIDLLITLSIYTVAVGINLLFAFRVMYMVKQNKDPIKALKKEEKNNTLGDVLINQKEYNEINGI
jgi:hypothetical protein